MLKFASALVVLMTLTAQAQVFLPGPGYENNGYYYYRDDYPRANRRESRYTERVRYPYYRTYSRFDREGYNSEGYNEAGYNRWGFNRYGNYNAHYDTRIYRGRY